MDKLEIGYMFKKMQEIFFKKTSSDKVLDGFDKSIRKKIIKEEGLVNILSPGRINIIGEHTDYNLGLSLPMAINKYKFFSGIKNNTDKVEIYDIGYDQYYDFRLDDIGYNENVKWSNYIKGVVKQYVDNNNEISGFSMIIDSNLISGSGISSSAAILAGVAIILEGIFNLNNPKEKILEYCHSAENDFVGVENGYLDHFAVLYGKRDNAIFLNFKNLDYEYIPLNLKSYLFLIIDSKEERFLPATDYNKRRKECNDAFNVIKNITKNKTLSSLSDIDLNLLEDLKGKLPLNLFKRVKHVVTENSRVIKAKKYFKEGDMKSLGEILLKSHRSLKDDYEVSTEKLDYLVKRSIAIDGVLGTRLMGAGFGGCVISLVDKRKVENIKNKLTEDYYGKFKLTPAFVKCESSDGTVRVNN